MSHMEDDDDGIIRDKNSSLKREKIFHENKMCSSDEQKFEILAFLFLNVS